MKNALKDPVEEREASRKAPSRLAPPARGGAVQRVCATILTVLILAVIALGTYRLFQNNHPDPVPPSLDNITPPDSLAGNTAPEQTPPVTPEADPDPAQDVNSGTAPEDTTPADPQPAEVKPAAPSFTHEGLEEKVAETVANIITSDMTNVEKARAIFDFAHDNIRYTGDSDKSNWEAGAYEGLTKRKGDCFTYYAVSRALLTAVGIDNLEVTRVGGPTSHYWNLIDCGAGWYHFDATPRSSKMPAFVSFMFTDQEAADYTAKAGRNYYTFDGSLYPERATGEEEPDAQSSAPEEQAPAPEAANDGGQDGDVLG